MIDTIKKTLLAGVGAAIATRDRVQAGLEDLVRQGKITAEEARTAAERVAKDGKRQFEDAADRLGKNVNELLARADGKVHSRIQDLEARVMALERKKAKVRKATGRS
jgi:polyhydroxyalkanoate synthesis regulator phasin